MAPTSITECFFAFYELPDCVADKRLPQGDKSSGRRLSREQTRKVTARDHRKAVALTQESEPAILDTLAAAYAADENFDRAISVVDSALVIAMERGNTALIQSMRQRKGLYLRHIAFTQ